MINEDNMAVSRGLAPLKDTIGIGREEIANMAPTSDNHSVVVGDCNPSIGGPLPKFF